MKEVITIKLLLMIIATSLFLFLGCSDDTAGPGGFGDSGEVSITVTGDFSAQKTGQADFWALESFGLYIWELSFNDFSPQTFSLDLILSSFEPIQRPGPGTYQIGFDPANPNQVFLGIYTSVRSQNFSDSVDYETGILCGDGEIRGGELVISSSSENRISGTFQFTAGSYDFDNSGNCIAQGSIQVSGEFDATPRRFF